MPETILFWPRASIDSAFRMYQICKNQFEYKNLLKVNFFDEFFLCAVSNDSSETENGSAQALHTHTIMKIKMFLDETSLELIAAEKKNTLQVLEYKRSKSNHSKNVVWGRNNWLMVLLLHVLPPEGESKQLQILHKLMSMCILHRWFCKSHWKQNAVLFTSFHICSSSPYSFISCDPGFIQFNYLNLITWKSWTNCTWELQDSRRRFWKMFGWLKPAWKGTGEKFWGQVMLVSQCWRSNPAEQPELGLLRVKLKPWSQGQAWRQ